jgi:phosphoenolpyruvate-protein phosphotransferase (PTS system enzyme I)
MINDISEVERTCSLLEESRAELRAEGVEVPETSILGAMIETPAAALTARELSRHVDFFSVGTNDLVQYTLAVDRGNAKLSRLYNPFHPSVIRLIDEVAVAGRAAGIEVAVCGELASTPFGAFLLIGMGVDSLSVGPASLAEIKKVIRSVSRADAEAAARRALRARTPGEVLEVLSDGLGDAIDLSLFMQSWSLSGGD